MDKTEHTQNLNERDGILFKIPDWDQQRVRAAHVLVAGAGALGNEVLKNLALLNVGTLTIIDFDHIERSNLSRSALFREEDCHSGKGKAETAALRLRELNPGIQVNWLNGDLMTDIGLGFFRRADVVIGCLDNRLARLYLNRYSHWLGKTWVNGGILNLAGQVNVYPPGISCYECELTEKDWKNIRIRMGCTDIARRNSHRGSVPTSPLSASIIGAVQVQEAMKMLFEESGPSLAGKRWVYDGKFNKTDTYKARGLKEFCDSHWRIPEVLEAPELNSAESWKSAATKLKKRLQVEEVSLELDHTLITKIATRKTGKTHSIILPQHRFSDELIKKLEERPGEGIAFPPDGMVHEIGENFSAPHLTLQELGIPPLHILRIRAGSRRFYVELTGDLSHFQFQKQ